MDHKDRLLARINKDVPPGIDWRQGAIEYVQQCFSKFGRDKTERYALTKPFALCPRENEAMLTELIEYFYNFINMLQLIRPGMNTRVLDVACGGGWLSHFLAKIGCHTFGFDICDEFVALARRRLTEDHYLSVSDTLAKSRFAVHDIEASPLPATCGLFDVAILESCLHHFADPVSAMSHVQTALKDDGVAVVIEGENRKGEIKEEYLSVMREFRMLERPYAREEFLEIMKMAGLPHVQFFGKINGWFLKSDAPAAAQHIVTTADLMNLAVVAKSEAALRRAIYK